MRPYTDGVYGPVTRRYPALWIQDELRLEEKHHGRTDSPTRSVSPKRTSPLCVGVACFIASMVKYYDFFPTETAAALVFSTLFFPTSILGWESSVARDLRRGVLGSTLG